MMLTTARRRYGTLRPRDARDRDSGVSIWEQHLSIVLVVCRMCFLSVLIIHG